MEKHIYFVRHGESDSNADGIVRGESAMLSEKGIQQARAVAERIRKIGVGAIISSSFQRTLDTAAEISKVVDLQVEQSDLFVERRRPSITIGRHRTQDLESRRVMHEVFEGYATETHRHSDEENFSDLRARVNAALSYLEDYPQDRICVVTHGIFLGVLFCAAINGPEFSGRELQNALRAVDTDNTGVSHFILREDHWASVPVMQWQIKNWNDSAHLG